MATISNPTFYAGGSATSSPFVGFDNYGGSKYNCVLRYDLTLGANESASHFKFSITAGPEYTCFGYTRGSGSKYINSEMSLYFYIGTDPNEGKNYGYAEIGKGTKVTLTKTSSNSIQYTVEGEADVCLLKNTQYYLWIYPGYSNDVGGNDTYGAFYVHETVNNVVLSGAAGVIKIDTGSGWVDAIPYIDDGTKWVQAVPYIDNGSGWNICS